jgi:hypothetical protein
MGESCEYALKRELLNCPHSNQSFSKIGTVGSLVWNQICRVIGFGILTCHETMILRSYPSSRASFRLRSHLYISVGKDFDYQYPSGVQIAEPRLPHLTGRCWILEARFLVAIRCDKPAE